MRFSTETHIPGASGTLNFLTPLVKDLQILSATTLIGLLLAIGFFIREERSKLLPEAIRIRNLAVIPAAAWLMSSLGVLFVELANLLAAPISDSFDPVVIRSFITQTALGKSFGINIAVAAIVLLLVPRISRTTGSFFTLAITFIGVLAPVFQSHSSSSGNHGLAIGSLLIHVIGISLWVGGIIALILINKSERALAIPRFSTLALWSAIAVCLSGSINAWTRLNFREAWNSQYGNLVIYKIILSAILIFIGATHRKFIMRKLAGSRQVYQLLIVEVLVMITAISVGAWLATSAPPLPANPRSIGVAESIAGSPMLPAPSLQNILWTYVPDAAFLGILILITALYIRGVVILSKRGDKWPVGRTISFALAVAATDFATSGGLGAYAHFAFSYHMIAHMILGMVAPIGFVLSAPITLALRTLPIGRTPDERGIRGNLISLLHSKYFQVISNPVVALAIFDGSLFLLYMTPLFGDLMLSHFGHLLMNLHFLFAGVLFFHVIVGIDPSPKRVPYIVRIIVLFAAMSIHAFFSIALLSATTLLDGGYFLSLERPWSTDLLADQSAGGAIGWAMGEIPILIALIATFIQWVRDDKKETRRIDRAEDRAAAMGEDDDLAKYNKYLAGLSRLDESEET
ncbi:MAG: cytochrome c oxidase assembly protein [Actinomycetes bacterium]